MWAKGRDVARGRAEVTRGGRGQAERRAETSLRERREAPEFLGSPGNQTADAVLQHCRDRVSGARLSARARLDFPDPHRWLVVCLDRPWKRRTSASRGRRLALPSQAATRSRQRQTTGVVQSATRCETKSLLANASASAATDPSGPVAERDRQAAEPRGERRHRRKCDRAQRFTNSDVPLAVSSADISKLPHQNDDG
jgi:hypothetical protein